MLPRLRRGLPCGRASRRLDCTDRKVVHELLAARNPYSPSRFLQFCRSLIDRRGVVLKRVGHAHDFFIRFRIVLFFDSFAHAGESLGAVAGVEARSVDQMLVPAAAGNTIRISEPPFCLRQFVVQARERCPRSFLTPSEKGADGFGIAFSAAIQQRLSVIQRREVDERRNFFFHRKYTRLSWIGSRAEDSVVKVLIPLADLFLAIL